MFAFASSQLETKVNECTNTYRVKFGSSQQSEVYVLAI